MQRFVVITIVIYLIFLLLKKYSNFKYAISILIALFCFILWRSSQNQCLNLTDRTIFKAYPDEIKIKDDWFSGVGVADGQKVLISGKISKEDQRLIKKGYPLMFFNINGDLSKIDPATNIGEFDFQKYYAAKRIFQRVKFKSFRMKMANLDWQGYCHMFRFRLQEYFMKMPRLLGFFTSELILAENNSMNNQDILNNYRDLGVIHLLSISGLHVGIYTLAVSTLCYLLKFTEKETFIFCVVVLVIGIFLSNYQPGFVRASLAYVLGKVFSFKKLKIAGIDLLGLTCLVYIMFLPRLFMGIGAILSYVLALGLQLTSKMSKLKQSVTLNLLLTPLLLVYFFQVNVLTVFFNMLIVPYFNWLVIPITFFNLIVFSRFSNLSYLFEDILEKCETVIGNISQTKIGMITFGKINWWQCLLLLALTFVFVAYLNEKVQSKKIKSKFIGTISLIYTIFFAIIHFPLIGQVTFIDVGQGDSILITTPFPRKVFMIDTGGKLNFSGRKQQPQVERITLPFLKAQGINKIDGLFVSHQDADHVGDVRALLKEIQINNIYMAQGLIKNPSFRKRVEGVIDHTKLVELLAGMQTKNNPLNFQVVYPFRAGEGKNEDSLSIFFELANKKWLFTGDLGQDGEKELIHQFPNLRVDYFKLGHHGSKTASNPEFLKIIHPELVFISAGRNNRFGHPHQETLETLKAQSIPWASTQDCGMISWYYGYFQKPKFVRFLQEGSQ
ncbi:hypothetical protein FC39_GL000296 [Lactobacillus hamsteri DSM 5661 = JCM 6256]|uniref:Metallo-beta-lactamase domain-containing protein n=2 Tax=Lactobacillus hamsteri TaxID=96565 RepID=A0A0R1Y956_9LACO|nr:hypothetical protein FC39_GL000296 [Lactobacillus hamsteri DSM 5661 = JCM 6256]